MPKLIKNLGSNLMQYQYLIILFTLLHIATAILIYLDSNYSYFSFQIILY